MMTVLFVFLAFAFAALLFSSIQEDLPEELAWLKQDGIVKRKDGSTVQNYGGWRVTLAKDTVELYKPFATNTSVNGVTYMAPAIGILCHEKKLDIRVKTNAQITGTETSDVKLGTGGFNLWQKGADSHVFPPDAKAALRAVMQSPAKVDITLSYAKYGKQTSTLDTTGLKELIDQLPSSCRP